MYEVDRKIEIDAANIWETRMQGIYQKIREQEATAIKVLSFLNEYRKDLLPPYNYLKAEMLAAGLPPVSSRVLEFFDFSKDDYESSTDLLKVAGSLQRKLEENPEETEKRWLEFISEAEGILARAPKTDGVEAISWLMGPDIGIFETGTNFLSPTKEHKTWAFKTKAPPAKYLAAWLVTEYNRKKQADMIDIDQWLGTTERKIEVDDKVDQTQIERIFGTRGPGQLFDLLPSSLQKAVNGIYLVDKIEDEEVEAPPSSDSGEARKDDEEESSTVLELEEEESATVLDADDAPVAKIDGFFLKETRTMVLAINESSDANDVVNLLFHELGHAMISGNSLIDQAVRRRFLKAMAAAGFPKGREFTEKYVRNTYGIRGVVEGLEEDFAEALRNFCLNTRKFQATEPERFKAIKEILTKFFPDFDLVEVQKKIGGFLKDADSRK